MDAFLTKSWKNSMLNIIAQILATQSLMNNINTEHYYSVKLTPNTLNRIDVRWICCVGMVRFSLLNSSRAGEEKDVAMPPTNEDNDAIKVH